MSVQFLAIVVESAFDPAVVTKEMWESAMAAHAAFAAAVGAAGGRVLSSAGLQAEEAFTVTPPRDGRPAVVSDGPFAEARARSEVYRATAPTITGQSRRKTSSSGVSTLKFYTGL